MSDIDCVICNCLPIGWKWSRSIESSYSIARRRSGKIRRTTRHCYCQTRRSIASSWRVRAVSFLFNITLVCLYYYVMVKSTRCIVESRCVRSVSASIKSNSVGIYNVGFYEVFILGEMVNFFMIRFILVPIIYD